MDILYVCKILIIVEFTERNLDGETLRSRLRHLYGWRQCQIGCMLPRGGKVGTKTLEKMRPFQI